MVSMLLRCMRISVFSLSRHLQNQEFEVWPEVRFCLRSSLRFQCFGLVFVFIFFSLPTTSVEGTTCLIILSLGDGKVGSVGYSRLQT